MKIEQVLYKTLKDGGCTFGPLDDQIFLPGSPYYALSLHKECEEVVHLKGFSVENIWQYLARHKEKFDLGLCLGTWVHEGKVFLDITQLFHKEYFTLSEIKSKAVDQIAAWDLETSTLIPFDYDTKETLN
jgi:hypothetical protein